MIVRSKVFFQVVGFAVQLLPTTGNVSVFKSITSFLTKLFQVTPLGMEQFTDELTNQVGPVVFSQLFQVRRSDINQIFRGFFKLIKIIAFCRVWKRIWLVGTLSP